MIITTLHKVVNAKKGYINLFNTFDAYPFTQYRFAKRWGVDYVLQINRKWCGIYYNGEEKYFNSWYKVENINTKPSIVFIEFVLRIYK